MICRSCSRYCRLMNGRTGFCQVRVQKGNRDVPVQYGYLHWSDLLPAQKIPFARFASGREMLAVSPGSGCTMHCRFCPDRKTVEGKRHTREISPEKLTALALDLTVCNVYGICFMGAEPLLHWEYVLETAKTAAARGLKTAVVTSGMASKEVISVLLPYLDAIQVRLQGFSEGAYSRQQGSLLSVKNFIHRVYGCVHLEINAYCYEGCNDTESTVQELAAWIAQIDPQIPLILTRRIPARHRKLPYALKEERMEQLRRAAQQYLECVCVDYNL